MFRFRVYVYLIDDTPFTDRCVPPYSLCSFRRKSYHLKSCRITTYKLTQLRNATMSWYLRTTSNININHVNYLKVTAKGIGCWCYLHTTTKVLGISYAQSGDFMDSSPFSPIYLPCAVAERWGFRVSKRMLKSMQFFFKKKPRSKLTFILISRLLCPQKALKAPNTQHKLPNLLYIEAKQPALALLQVHNFSSFQIIH